MKSLKKIPKFKSLTQESIFWQKHNSVDYIEWDQAKEASFPNLKPSTESISLRLPEGLLNEIKILANKQDIPYQSFMKVLLTKGVSAFKNQRI